MPLFTKNNRIVLPKQPHCLPKTMALFYKNNRIVFSCKFRLNFSNPYLVSSKLDLQRKRVDLLGFLKDNKLSIFGLEIDIKKFSIK
ncbi:MAG: hypothetical protein PHG98_05240 [Bacteroidales bacterium]|nr:hypothetical protein [Bacteroidales bacterium]MDD3668284.1 hypothetical protein [Bacteroidales bacterium]MDD4068272.1 hypothetical protein [Bacteroidales bacterium]MDD4739339.1 hypothetical protein [Bacteroidales bacterium]